MRKLTILVDMDDTLEHLMLAWMDAANKKFNRNVKMEDFTVWDVSAPYEGISHDEVYDIPLHDEFWSTVTPFEHADKVLKKWIDMGHDIYIVTATAYESVKGKMDNCLFKYFPFLTWDKVILTCNKLLIKGDILIDDGIHNLEDNPIDKKILMTLNYNIPYDAEAHGMTRVHDWYEIEKIVDEYMNEPLGRG